MASSVTRRHRTIRPATGVRLGPREGLRLLPRTPAALTGLLCRVREEPMAAGLGLLAFAILLPGAWWGLPQATNPSPIHGWDVDGISGIAPLAEMHNLFVVTKPDWYVAYPLFHYFVLMASYAPYLAYLVVSGGLSTPSATYPFGMADPVTTIATLAFLGRLVTVFMASGLIVATYLTAKVTWGKTAAGLAGAIVLLAEPTLFYGRTGNLDIPVLFWTSLALLVMARAATGGFSVGRAVWLGIFAALAVATKDQAYGGLVPALAVLVLMHLSRDRGPGDAPTARRWQAPLALLLSGAATYVVAGGLVISPSRYLAHLAYIADFRNTFYNVANFDILRPQTSEGYALLVWDVVAAVMHALGPVFLLAAVLGAISTWRSTPLTKILVAMALGHVALTIIPIMHMQYRYAMLLVLVGALLGGRALSVGLQMRGFGRFAVLGALLLGLGGAAVQGMDLTYQMLHDARYQAGEWLARHARAGDTLAYFGGVDQLPALPPGVTARQMPRGAVAAEVLTQENVSFVLVSPDFFSEAGMDRSPALPEGVYERLKDGSLGFQRVAAFRTEPLVGTPLRYLPFVNPPVQVFHRVEPAGDRSP
jgi:hypothetical protein